MGRIVCSEIQNPLMKNQSCVTFSVSYLIPSLVSRVLREALWFESFKTVSSSNNLVAPLNKWLTSPRISNAVTRCCILCYQQSTQSIFPKGYGAHREVGMQANTTLPLYYLLPPLRPRKTRPTRIRKTAALIRRERFIHTLGKRPRMEPISVANNIVVHVVVQDLFITSRLFKLCQMCFQLYLIILKCIIHPHFLLVFTPYGTLAR